MKGHMSAKTNQSIHVNRSGWPILQTSESKDQLDLEEISNGERWPKNQKASVVNWIPPVRRSVRTLPSATQVVTSGAPR